MSLHTFDGPHFDRDLIGPDGRLSRLCKGGRKLAGVQAAQQIEQNERQFKIQQEQAKKLAAEQKVNQEQENIFRQQELDQNEKMLNRSGSSPASQYIKGNDRKKRGAYGIQQTRGANAFGLGGGRGTLG